MSEGFRNELLSKDLDNRFSYHSPKDDQPDRYNEIRKAARVFIESIDLNCPRYREKSIAMTNLEQAMFWANASIARNE